MLKKATEQDWANVEQNLTETTSDVYTGSEKGKNNEINLDHVAPRKNSEEKNTIEQNETNGKWNSAENFSELCTRSDIVTHDKTDLNHAISHKQF